MAKKPTKPPKMIRSRESRLASMDTEIVDVEGAAGLLGVSMSTVYKLAGAGTLPGVKVGKEWRFARRNLVAWVAQQGNGNGNGSPADELEALLKKANVRARR